MGHGQLFDGSKDPTVHSCGLGLLEHRKDDIEGSREKRTSLSKRPRCSIDFLAFDVKLENRLQPTPTDGPRVKGDFPSR